jgi:BirA family biotin operon repressor/biotin-[acetyl-CoA-carboxylase] ligase
MDLRTDLIPILSDGRFHSGTELGRRLGVSRTTVHNVIDALADAGLDIHRVPGRGYRIPGGIEVLDADRIAGWLDDRGARRPASLEILDKTPSTNAHLLRRGMPRPGEAAVCVAERQTAGRGRRGRTWVATPYRNVMLSMAWRYDSGPGATSGLSLAAGVAVADALDAAGAGDVGLKWPNDVVWNGRKLAGVLVDVAGEAQGPTLVVLGIGVNVRLSDADGRLIEQPWVDLVTVVDEAPARNRLVALLIEELSLMFEQFSRGGYPAFRDRWELRNVYAGAPVSVIQSGGELRGSVLGTDERGALLLLDGAGRTHVLASGEVSLRGAS